MFSVFEVSDLSESISCVTLVEDEFLWNILCKIKPPDKI